MITKTLAQFLFAASLVHVMPLDGAVLEWQAASVATEVAGRAAAQGSVPSEFPHLPIAENRLTPPPKKVDVDSFGVVTSAQSAIVLDAASGAPLYAKNPQEQRAIGSITKLMSTLVFLETNPDLTRFVTLNEDDFAGTGRVYLYYNDPVRLRDVLGAALVGSDNTATLALARLTGLSQDEFVARMNDKAQELGLAHTHFSDPSGLSASNVSTVGDIAIMLREAKAHPEIADFMTDTTLNVAHASGRVSAIPSTNLLLSSFLNTGDYKITGGKTGYIPQAGYCLTTAVAHDGHEIIVVVLGSDERDGRFDDAMSLAAWAFDTFSWDNL